MRKGVAYTGVLLLAVFTGIALPQSTPGQANSYRKVTSRIAPNYPELAKKMHLRGIVRVEAVVRANGSVKSTRIMGGNPVLVDAAADAVSKWKFEPGPNETTELIQLTFVPE
jgi:TonB family protein